MKRDLMTHYKDICDRIYLNELNIAKFNCNTGIYKELKIQIDKDIKDKIEIEKALKEPKKYGLY